MGDEVVTDLETGVLHTSEWLRRWDIDDTPWYTGTHEPFLEQRAEEIFQDKKRTVFVPLCGKTKDMLWMYQQGHTVYGVDVAEQAVKGFFEDNSLPYDVQDTQTGRLYKTKDDRVKIYATDLFNITKDVLPPIDVIWDIGSFVAINKDDRQRYSALLTSLMKPDTLYFMWVMEYDPAVWPGPPHTVPLECIQQCYGDCCNIEVADKTENIKMCPMVKQAKLDPNKPSAAATMGMKQSSYLHYVWYKLTAKS